MASSATAFEDRKFDAATPDMAPASPTSSRIAALDFVRGAALFGILLMNITGFGLPNAYSNPMNAGGAEGANLLSWIIIQIGFEGTQRGLFSMLFGAGVILFTSRLEAKGRSDVADIYMRRNLWLAAFGLVNGYLLLWSGDILFYYGLTALLIFSFRNMMPKWLLLIGAGALLFSAALSVKSATGMMDDYNTFAASQVSGAQLTDERQEQAESWEKAVADHEQTEEERQAYTAARTGGYSSAFSQVAAETGQAQSWGFYRYMAFDGFGMMLIGMALFKWGVFTLERSQRFYWGLVIVGYGIGLTTNTLETRWVMENDFSLLAFNQSWVTYDLGRLATTAGHLGLLLLIARSRVFPLLQHAVASVGRMAFTNYLTHSVVCAIFFVGFGYFGQLQRFELYYVVLIVCVAQLILSPIWLKYFKMGPLEWLWRYLTYMEAPAMRKRAMATA
ncbi:DUF418 domain-containing protein [Erythrobacter ani]|uniref:DUF418 domain-containing protein n=1 Tax=Erythrobacter ani TaxID=2827235 RepID=A0ABS6SN05_9SPHN|nr:DUF418 domain-containing protein [Erythrobacter ani]MBV7266418.1 DUF418 domain-containing protein [Erythrobacter ani]